MRLSTRVPNLQAMKATETRLVQYAESGEFKRVVMNVIAKKATTEDILELRNIFNEFDGDGDGTITFTEFKKALAQSNFTDDEIRSIFQKLVRCAACHAGYSLSRLASNLVRLIHCALLWRSTGCE